MTPTLATRFARQARALWWWCLSFLKRDWELGDYPISIRTQEPDPVFRGPRFQFHRYAAQIVNWGLAGTGDTKEEALSDLARIFTNVKAERKKTGTPLPRPGARVPPEFASGDRVYAHPELVDDFIRRVLDLPWAFVSDESSLWDFHSEETNDALNTKIKEVYGVDVSDIESARLWEIFERIAAHQRPG